jgi:DNA-binding IscR family transcriptional regulator
VISTRFAVSLHILRLLVKRPMTSEEIAAEIGTNSTVIRRLIAPMRRAGMVRSTNRMELVSKPEELALVKVWQCAELSGPFIERHDRVPASISTVIRRAEMSLLCTLANTTLASILEVEERNKPPPRRRRA